MAMNVDPKQETTLLDEDFVADILCTNDLAYRRFVIRTLKSIVKMIAEDKSAQGLIDQFTQQLLANKEKMQAAAGAGETKAIDTKKESSND